MRCITLTQPWATLVAIGAKKIETRSWPTSYCGPLAIHAAKTFPGWAKDRCMEDPFRKALGWQEPPKPLTQEWLDAMAFNIKHLPVGCVVATCKLVNCLRTDIVEGYVQPFTDQEREFGDYSEGRFAFILDDIKPLPEPIPAKGALGVWEWKC